MRSQIHSETPTTSAGRLQWTGDNRQAYWRAGYNVRVEYSESRHIGAILKERNIILKGADAATAKGFTMVPNFVLKSGKLTAGDKMTFAMLLSYAWQNNYCF